MISGEFVRDSTKYLTDGTEPDAQFIVRWEAVSIADGKITLNWEFLSRGNSLSKGYVLRTNVKIGSNTVVEDIFTVNVIAGKETLIRSGTTTIAYNNTDEVDVYIGFSGQFISGTHGNMLLFNGTGTETVSVLSTLSADDGTLGEEQTLTVNQALSGFSHDISYTGGTVCTGSSDTSVPFTPPLSLASLNTTGTTVLVDLKITTYNGNAAIGSNTVTVIYEIPESVKPSLSLSVSDLTAYYGTYGYYLQRLSRLKIEATPQTAYGAEITECKIEADGNTYKEQSVETGALKNAGTLTVTATVTDTRGRSTSVSTYITVAAYNHPAITLLKVKRCNADGSENMSGGYVQVTFSCSVTALGGANTAKYELEYGKTSEASVTEIVFDEYENDYEVTDATYIFEAETGSSYNVKITVVDSCGVGVRTTIASTAFVLLHFLASGLGMGIGKIAELANVLDINFQTRLLGGILQPVLETGTDLNTLLTPNTYDGLDAAGYANCPVTEGRFALEVISASRSDKYIIQRLTRCVYGSFQTYERHYCGSVWDDWTCIINK